MDPFTNSANYEILEYQKNKEYKLANSITEGKIDILYVCGTKRK